jgi:hypothetical protein
MAGPEARQGVSRWQSWHRIAVDILIATLALQPTVSAQVVDAKRPVVVSFHDTRTGARSAVGLIYSPNTLASLVRQAEAASVSSRIIDAIERGMPIVVMWSFPLAQGRDGNQWPRPFHLAIVERGGDVVGPRIDPMWTAQDAADLRRLDPATEFAEVGAVAAFPAQAFVSGRWIVLYSSDKLPGQRKQFWGVVHSTAEAECTVEPHVSGP